MNFSRQFVVRSLFISALLSLFFFNVEKAFAADLILPENSLRFSPAQPVEGQPARLYAYAVMAEPVDATGMIQFFVEEKSIGSTQPISVVNNRSDDVFVDWTPEFGGFVDIKVHATLSSETDSNPLNNVLTLYDVFVDYDTDGDNVGNIKDTDDDNDGISDEQEKLLGTNPLKVDTDNDGVNDKEDSSPIDPSVSSANTSSSSNSEPVPLSSGTPVPSSASGGGSGSGSNGGSNGGSSGGSGSDGSGSGVGSDGSSGGGGGGGNNFASPEFQSEISKTEKFLDTDTDGIPDAEDEDDDNDRISDTLELRLGLNPKTPATEKEYASVFSQPDEVVKGVKVSKEEPQQQILVMIFLMFIAAAAIFGFFLYNRKKRHYQRFTWKQRKF